MSDTQGQYGIGGRQTQASKGTVFIEQATGYVVGADVPIENAADALSLVTDLTHAREIIERVLGADRPADHVFRLTKAAAKTAARQGYSSRLV